MIEFDIRIERGGVYPYPLFVLASIPPPKRFRLLLTSVIVDMIEVWTANRREITWRGRQQIRDEGVPIV